MEEMTYCSQCARVWQYLGSGQFYCRHKRRIVLHPHTHPCEDYKPKKKEGL